jgi:hypothetical protein
MIMRNYVRICFLYLLAASLCLPANASPDTERRYLVEVVIFKNLGPDSSDGELWEKSFALPPEAPTPGNATAFPGPGGAIPLIEMPADTGDSPGIPGQPIIDQPNLVHMVHVLAKLESSGRYEVLIRRAWTQPMRDRSNAIPVPMGINPALTANLETAMVYPPPAPVTGSVKMYEQRLLFIEVDVAARIPTAMASDPGSLVNPVDFEYRITETRRVRLNEVHYFDHPYFGVLVRVSRVEPGQSKGQASPVTDGAAPVVRTQDPPTSGPPN